ncbi:PKD domain-containing protein [Aliagarivorans taiwanensis]|uniref:PKD domain-containing protein n=1 Tax=Aliagarivorans taiwanensis TaxID=561966 RepID=UPI00040DD4A3|nr:PKD domain-containing protein [Aliagarivorans taiwanensis]
MLKNLYCYALYFLLASILAGCGGTSTTDPREQVKPTPVITVVGNNYVYVGETASFSAANSSSENGSIVGYLWTLDGKQFRSPTLDYTFATAGSYTINLQVEDRSGEKASTSITFHVLDGSQQNLPPTASITASASTVLVNQVLTLNAEQSFDPDGEIASYRWEVLNDEQATKQGVEASFSFTTTGSKTIELTVTDNEGLEGRAQVVVQVLDENQPLPPTAVIDAPVREALAGQTLNFNASASSSPNGDIIKYQWFTLPACFEEACPPVGPTLVGESATLAHSFISEGVFELSLTITDSAGESAHDSVLITINPVEGGTVTAKISPDGTQQVSQGTQLSFSAAGSSSDASVIVSYRWSLLTANGGVQQLGTGQQVTHRFSTQGSFSLRLQVEDYQGNTDEAFVAIEVTAAPPVNQAPVAQISPTGEQQVEQGEQLSFDGSSSYDPDGDSLSYLWSNGATTASVTLSFDTIGTEQVCLVVNDGALSSAEQCVTVVVKAKPVTSTVVYYQGSFPNIYAWDGASLSPYTKGWPGDAMQNMGSYKQYDFGQLIDGSLMVIFNQGDSAQTDDLSFNPATPCYSNNGWHQKSVCTEGENPVEPPPVGGTSETLGAVYSQDATTFSIWSPDHSNVTVTVDGQDYSMAKVNNFAGYSDVYQTVVSGDLHLAEYTFKINGVPVRDPYGKMVRPGTGIYEATNIVMDMSRLQPEGGWTTRPALINRTDAIIYEVHVRDFTIHQSSGVSPQNRGKYLGMVESGTRHNGVATGIDHLIDLGVTHVQLLPVYDFATCDGLPDSDPCYNWGYDPRNYNVPEERYAQDMYDYEQRVIEFKTMVNEFHKAGIRVIMDVVYNHTYDNEMFENISNRYFTPTDLSGTGNSIDADVPMVSRLIQDSLEYWVDEYGIDGFRFDLIGIFSYSEVAKWGEHLNQRFPDRNLLLYGEPWNGYATDPKVNQRVRYGTTHHLANAHVGVFNGAYREAMKDQNDKPDCGWMCNNMDAWKVDGGWAIFDGMKGSPKTPGVHEGEWGRLFTVAPEQSINYISAHDNFGLWDKAYISQASNVSQASSHQVMGFTPPSNLSYAKRIVDFATGMVLTSQGIPFLHAGDEFLRTKTENGNISNASAWRHGQYAGTHNTYNSPDSFNAINWQWKVDNKATLDYSKALIALRNQHAGLRMTSNSDIERYLSQQLLNNGHVITGHITDPRDSHQLFVVFNNSNNFSVNLPAGSWTKVVDASGATNQGGLSGSVQVEGTAVTVFSQPR